MAPTSPLNEKLIACVLDHIEHHPDEYNQNLWIHLEDRECDQSYCGTQGCFAGWAMLLSTPVNSWVDRFLNGAKALLNRSAPQQGLNNITVDIREEAAKRLGLTHGEATRLFSTAYADGRKSLPIIKERLRTIRMNRGLPPDGPAPSAHMTDTKGDTR
jgi:hypothetical protein